MTQPWPPGRRPAAAAAPSFLRTMNQRLLLDHLFATGSATRPQLARDCGLSQPTVIAALDDLEKVGLVRPAAPPEQSLGRPAAAYEADPTAGHVTAVDIGRGWLRLLVTDLAGTDLARADVRNTARSAPALVELVGRSVADVVASAGLTADAITHTVIGSPGVLDESHGRLRYAVNLPGWHRSGLASALIDRLGGALTIDNDVNLAALGEHSYGTARDVRDFVYIHIGTGIGIGIYLDGRVYRGFTGAAGEIGYLPIGQNSSPMPPGRPVRGIMEEALAADAVVRYAKAAGMTGRITSERVFAAARAGDLAAKVAVTIEAQHLAQLVASICAFLDPELIVLGGAIGQNLDILEPDTFAALARLTPMQPRLTLGALGSDAVARGAAAEGIAIARETVFRSQVERST
jgi:predicted NBD/HSP70 family sugar kinase